MSTVQFHSLSLTHALPLLTLLFVLGATPVSAEEAKDASASTRPNIVLILADDMGPGEPTLQLPCQNATFRVSVFAASIDLTPRSILTLLPSPTLIV